MDSYNGWRGMWGGWLPYLLPLFGPITAIIALLLIGPCVVNALGSFVRKQFRSIHVNQLEVRYQALVSQQDTPRVTSQTSLLTPSSPK